MQDSVYLILHNKDFGNCFHMELGKREVDDFEKKIKKEEKKFSFELTHSCATGFTWFIENNIEKFSIQNVKKMILLTPRRLKTSQNILE